MTKPKQVRSHLYVTQRSEPRLCRRPERIPGVAPPREDDMAEDRRRRAAVANGSAAYGGVRPAPVSLARIPCLEKAQ